MISRSMKHSSKHASTAYHSTSTKSKRHEQNIREEHVHPSTAEYGNKLRDGLQNQIIIGQQNHVQVIDDDD